MELAQNEDLPWVDSGGLFFLFLHTSNEFISGEKPLLTFLSNLSRSLLRLFGDMKEEARDTMIRDKFIAGQGQCALRRQWMDLHRTPR